MKYIHSSKNRIYVFLKLILNYYKNLSTTILLTYRYLPTETKDDEYWSKDFVPSNITFLKQRMSMCPVLQVSGPPRRPLS